MSDFEVIAGILRLFWVRVRLFRGGEAGGSGDFDGGRCAISGGTDNLFETARTNVAGSVEAGDDGGVGEMPGKRVGDGDDIAGRIEEGRIGEEAVGERVKKIGRREFANEDKNVVESVEEFWGGVSILKDFNIVSFAGFVETLEEIGVGFKVGMRDDGEVLGKAGEVERLLDGGIRAADYGDVLPFYEVTIAKSAVGYRRTRGETEFFRGGAGRDEDFFRQDRSVVNRKLETISVTPKFLAFAIDDFGTSLGGLTTHLLSEVGAEAGETGIIREVGDLSKSAADAGTLEDLSLDAGASGVKGGGEGGRTAADDSEVKISC